MRFHCYTYLAIGMALACATSEPGEPGGRPKPQGKVHIVPIQGFVGPAVADFVARAIGEAKAHDAALIVLQIDTPGGRVDSAIDICNHVDAASPIATAAYIPDEALAAGALIALACDSIYMREVGSIGSATPVAQTTGGQAALGEKYISAVRAKFRAWAERNGHNALLAEAMVDPDLALDLVAAGGSERILESDDLEAERRKAQAQGTRIEFVKTIVAEGKLLNLTGREALSCHFISGLAESRDDVIAARGIRKPVVIEVRPTFIEKCRSSIDLPAVSGCLLIVALLTASGILAALALLGLRWLWRRLRRKGQAAHSAASRTDQT